MVELRRIFAPPEAFAGEWLRLDGERLHHLRAVLRLGPGDEFAVTDGAGAEYLARVEQLGRAAGRALVRARAVLPLESPLGLVLAQCPPRGDRFALVLEKAVELGVRELIPLVSQRTVPAGGAGAVARWRRVVESAVAQSGRTRLPVLRQPCPFAELLGDASLPELRLLLWEGAAAGLREIVDGRAAPRSALVAVGPEGSWSAQELHEAQRSGFVAVRLGPRILRAETAGIAALAILQNRWGDLG